MDEPGLLALALERHILPHVEVAPVEIKFTHRLQQWVDKKRPLIARHREGANVDVRRGGLRGCCSAGAIAAVVVAVHVEQDEPWMVFDDIVEQLPKHSVITRVMASERACPRQAGHAKRPIPSIVRAFHTPPPRARD